MLRAALKVLEHNADVAYVHGMAAFAYEECHLLGEAERAARRALELERKEPWAQHALAHVMLTQGRMEEGARFLEGVAPTWTDLNSFMITHLWWHVALFDLSRGRLPARSKSTTGIAGALPRNIRRTRWAPCRCSRALKSPASTSGGAGKSSPIISSRAPQDTVQPFLTLQYLYGLARAERAEARTCSRRCGARRAARRPTPARCGGKSCCPSSEGLCVHAQRLRTRVALTQPGDAAYDRDRRQSCAAGLLRAVLFGCRDGERDEACAQQMLELRRRADRDGVPLNTALASVYANLGLPAWRTRRAAA